MMSDIYLDGRFAGTCDDPEKMIKSLIDKRRNGIIARSMNVCYQKDKDEIQINLDSGRVRRPLVVVENENVLLTDEHIKQLNAKKITWNDLIKKGVIEYLDADEEENAYVALKREDVTKKHTHLELDPILVFGVASSTLAYPERDRGDRLNYGSRMAVQAVGIPSHNYTIRDDTTSDILVYPQKPIVETDSMECAGVNSHPIGQNLVIAIMPYYGYNIEDGLIINKASLERGLGRSITFRTYSTEGRRYWGGQEDEIGIPEKTVRGYKSEESYKKLDEDGIIVPGTIVESGDILVGKTSPLRFLGITKEIRMGIQNTRENSLTVKKGESGTVEKVILTQSGDGNKLIKVVIHETKEPEVGDKFATKHGQKGVVSLIVPEEDMPFTADGLTPDIIINPHAIPSRMTVGQLLEILAGKTGALVGERFNGTAFKGDEEKIRKALKAVGFRDDGKETMYNGITGDKIESSILIGIGHYHRLYHMVYKKLHARSRGPVALLTKQPTEGRAKEGGLRLGEMEKDCLVGHGASLVLKERFGSDKITIPICKKCGIVAIEDKIKGRISCPICKDKETAPVNMSYAFKLMLDELLSMLIYPRIIPENESGGNMKEIKFSLMSPQMVKKLSVMEMDSSEVYDADAYPIDGGVMDPKMGVIDPGMRCKTCGGRLGECSGHFGHIELAKPVINSFYVKITKKLLTHTCSKCGALLVDAKNIQKTKIDKTCSKCGENQEPIKFEKPLTFRRNKRFLTAEEIREQFEKISNKDAELLGVSGGRPEWLIVTLLPVPPITMRPSITLTGGERSEDDLTHKLVDVVRINQRFADNLELGAPDFILEDLMELLQYHVSTYFDNEISGLPPARHRSGRQLKTIAQRLKAKEGRFRHNLTGKRVNFSARTVISPDSNISLNEVGVPDGIAKELTIPIKVTDKNKKDIKSCIKRGPNEINGANYIIRIDGLKKKITDINKDTIAKEIETGDIVEKHISDGDIVLFNRQPSLHRMSIMAHKVKVMKGKTFRLNLCVCKPYNADFDGDEMNLHVPQTAEARAEAKELMLVEKNIRSPRFGGPIIGCDQDYISGSYLLTKRGTELSKKDVSQILANAEIKENLNKDKYSGKEVFSFSLPKNMNLEYKAKNFCKRCEDCMKEKCPYDAYVSIKGGELKSGLIDNEGLASFKSRLIDKIDSDFGHEEGRKFIERITKITMEFLMKKGFTISISEQDVSKKIRKKIDSFISMHLEKVDQLIEDYKKGKIQALPGTKVKDTLEDLILKELWEITNKTQKVINDEMSENSATIMAKSGARGNIQNLTFMSGVVGQETIKGRRIHRGYKNRTLPHFDENDLSSEAHGFVKSSFKTGVNPIEFFFEVMKGREGIMDSSLKTRISGYMQRRLINALQDVKIDYDNTVRTCEGNVVQFIPGEDNIDPAKSDWGKLIKTGR